MVGDRPFNSLDNLQILLEAIGIAYASEFEDGAEEVRFEFWFSLEQSGLPLHQDKRIFNDVLENEIP